MSEAFNQRIVIYVQSSYNDPYTKLKQSRLMWYNLLSEYLIKEGYKDDHTCPCIFIRKSESRFAIIAVYVDDINLIRTSEELLKIAKYLKKNWNERFGENKILSQSAIEHKTKGALIH